MHCSLPSELYDSDSQPIHLPSLRLLNIDDCMSHIVAFLNWMASVETARLVLIGGGGDPTTWPSLVDGDLASCFGRHLARQHTSIMELSFRFCEHTVEIFGWLKHRLPRLHTWS
jgi:hypothetical protein